ncbi:unnamed protein product, partial [Polarella glacialis]
ASRVLLNLSELHARRAEQATSAEDGREAGPFTEAQYALFLRAIECCEEAASLSDGEVGRREGDSNGAFAHLRVGVHLSVRIPFQSKLGDSRRDETIVDLADRHFGKALRCFDELKDEREIAVCHFHMADLALQEERIPGAPPMPKVRLTLALRHARKSADYWERSGALQYTKDFVASHIRVARLLESQQRSSAFFEATEHLAEVEATLVALANRQSPGSRTSNGDEGMFTLQGSKAIAVPPLRREMSRVCQAGIRQGEDVDRLKVLYRRVLRNEPIRPVQDSVPSPG